MNSSGASMWWMNTFMCTYASLRRFSSRKFFSFRFFFHIRQQMRLSLHPPASYIRKRRVEDWLLSVIYCDYHQFISITLLSVNLIFTFILAWECGGSNWVYEIYTNDFKLTCVNDERKIHLIKQWNINLLNYLSLSLLLNALVCIFVLCDSLFIFKWLCGDVS